MRLFVFLTKRPCDSQAWPYVYQSEELALKAPHRCSRVTPVEVDETIRLECIHGIKKWARCDECEKATATT